MRGLASLRAAHFRETRPAPGDVVYLDPPDYKTAQKGYRIKFGLGDHRELAALAAGWIRDGVTVIVSQRDSGEIRALYSDFRAIEYPCSRKTEVGVSGEMDLTLYPTTAYCDGCVPAIG